jgi:GT2 family glycosyltransferase
MGTADRSGGHPRRPGIEPTVSVIIPTYRDFALVRAALPRLLASSGVRLDVVVVNNDPEQQVARAIAVMEDPAVRAIEVGHNAGFMGAINRGIRATGGEYVLFHNADLAVTPTFCSELVRWLEARPEAAIAGGKILRLDPTTGEPDGRIDTAGIAVRRNRQSYDRGEGAIDSGQFAKPAPVFGISGAALMARRAALLDVAIDGEVLDESFFMYRDDFDLAWRLRLRGWQCWYVPTAIAYHARTGRGLGGRGYLRGFVSYVRNERRKGANVRLHSMKNQWLTLVKNEGALPLLCDLPWVAGRETLVFGANLVTAPHLWARSISGFARALPEARKQRRAIQSRAVVAPAAIRRRWFHA